MAPIPVSSVPLQNMTEELLQQLHAQLEGLLNAPVLRHCLIPTCRAEYDAHAAATGQTPSRPSWTAHGWLQLGAGTVIAEGGNICPRHKDLIRQHHPYRYGPGPDGRFSVRCGCGEWTSDPHAWHQVLRALWEEHLLGTGELPGPG